MFRSTTRNFKFSNKEMKRAARIAGSMAQSIRFIVIAGSLLYGKKVLQRQFFLRRITYLSLYCFGIISVLARIISVRSAGGSAAEDLKILAFFAEEARQYRKNNKDLFPYKKERLHTRVFKPKLSDF